MDGHTDYMVEIRQPLVQSTDIRAVLTACCNKLSPSPLDDRNRVKTQRERGRNSLWAEQELGKGLKERRRGGGQ